MSYDDCCIGISVPPFPMRIDFPDISQVRKNTTRFFGATEGDDFFGQIRQHFNDLMEGQKFIKSGREIGTDNFGFRNLEVNPSLNTHDFVKAAQNIRGGNQLAAQPVESEPIEATFLDESIDSQNFEAEVGGRVKQSLAKVSDALRYIKENKPEIESKWSNHNASIFTQVSVFAHPDEFFTNLQLFIDDMTDLVSNEGGDKKDKFQEKLDAIKSLRDEIQGEYGDIQAAGLQDDFRARENQSVGTISLGNMAMSASHRRRVFEALDKRRAAKQGEMDRERAVAKSEARSRAMIAESQKRSSAAAAKRIKGGAG